MIIEVVNFMKEFEMMEKNAQQLVVSEDYDIDLIKEQFPVIFLIEVDWNLENPYKGFRVITNQNDELVKDLPNVDGFSILRKEKELIKVLDFKKYTSTISDPRKYIGSTSGLNTFSFFHFKLESLFRKPLYKNGKNKPLERISKLNLRNEHLELILDAVKSDTTKEFINEIINSNKNKEKSKIIIVYEQFYRELLKVFGLLDKNNKDILGGTKLKNSEYKKIKSERYIKNIKNKVSEQEYKLLEKQNKLLRLCEKAYVFLNYKNYQVIEELFEQYIILKLFVTRDTIIESTCPVCGRKGEIGNISNYTTFNPDKPFSIKFDRYIENTLKICIYCTEYFNNFLYFLKENKINIFPLFIEESLLKKEIEFIKSLKKKDKDKKNFFFQAIKRIQDISNLNSFDILLVHIVDKKKLIFFDYITNYSVYFSGNSEYIEYFGTNSIKKFGKEDLLKKLGKIFDLKINFFGDIDTMKKSGITDQKYLIYKYRKKIFDTIYRSEICLTDNDIAEITTKILEIKFIMNSETPKESSTISRNEILNFYLNAELYSIVNDNFIKKNKKGEIMLDEIRKEKKKIINGESFKIDSPEKFAYYLGQMVYYLINKSNVDRNKKMTLLTPLVSVQSPTNLKRIVLEKYLEKYIHEISEYKDFRHIVFAETLNYLANNFSQPFNEVKISFYVGFFDKNIFFMEKEDTK
ncbi:MAG: hypothetical protein K9W46_13990 [Candidatus Heimdallarchaeum endolithica]|uniref:Type I-B CRISPR-associated protein Cas8b/Csh1 n=1 Tax=Candidatus Heimdallarchaeum endolithica TaxID=2876572 RepID=A0A9Y1FNT0_9ARCH|nr:MAG: hypothetical protein K9W46_13990 [Candidatus Heimdallarchaeum endolithica]